MGGAESKQQLGQRVIAARKKLDEERTIQDERSESLRNASPATMKLILDRMQQSFETFSPFLERTLLVAWNADQEKCKEFVLGACKKVLSAPIKEVEYGWFKQYVLSSSLWLFESSQKRFMYEELMAIVQRQSADIVSNMDSVYAHLESHSKWSALMAIKNQSIVDRQDHGDVGLLKDAGIQSIADEKDEEIRSFVDSHVAITALTVTAKAIDKEFQTYIEAVMGTYGGFKKGPMKKVERCLSKLENDYQEAAYPKSAKLLDIIRCSVTFNTLEQLLTGYRGLVHNMGGASSYMKLARVKNGFLDKSYNGGYRDIKVNVVFQSAINPEIKMVCEVQLILSQYLNEKKKIHKLYSIAREETYYQLIVQKEQKQAPSELRLTETLNIGKEVSLNYKDQAMYKCSVDSELNLLALDGVGWFGVVDMKQKKPILEVKKEDHLSGFHATHWLTIQATKYLAVQLKSDEITMYKVTAKKDSYKFAKDKKYKITVEGKIGFCQFDRTCQHIAMLVNKRELQIRSLSDVKKIKKSISLEHKIIPSVFRNIDLSMNGRYCVVGGGGDKPFFYVIDVDNEKVHELTSSYLSSAFAPCFINGESQFVFVSDRDGKMEIWDVELKQPVKTMQIQTKKPIRSSASTHNILAIGSEDDTLRLYDVRNWECFRTKKFTFDCDSLHLTDDLRFVTLAGEGGDRCVVLQID